MDIQQLTLVIGLIKDLADGAMLGFILYLVVAHVVPYLAWLLGLSAILFLVYKVMRAHYDTTLGIHEAEQRCNEDALWFKAAAARLGFPVTFWGNTERERVKNLIMTKLSQPSK